MTLDAQIWFQVLATAVTAVVTGYTAYKTRSTARRGSMIAATIAVSIYVLFYLSVDGQWFTSEFRRWLTRAAVLAVCTAFLWQAWAIRISENLRNGGARE